MTGLGIRWSFRFKRYSVASWVYFVLQEATMRIIYLPNKIYKLYDYAKKYNVWHAYREKYGKLINDYTYLRTQYKVTHNDLQEQFGISRATYYRRRRILNLLDSGAHIELCSKPNSVSLTSGWFYRRYTLRITKNAEKI